MRFAVLPVNLFKLVKFAFLPVKNLYYTHPGNMFLQKGIEVGYSISHFIESDLHLFLKNICRNNQKWESTQAHQRELPVNVKHHAQNGNQLQQITNNSGKSLTKDVSQCFYIGHISRHQPTDRCMVKKLQFHF